MPIKVHSFADQPRLVPEPYVNPGMPEEEVSVLGAAFRQENDVINAFQYLTRPVFEPNPEFDFKARAEQSQLFSLFQDRFIGVQSDAEWDHLESRIHREIRDRQAISAAGVPGIAAAMLAGVVSPTILLPAGQAATAANVAKGAASAARWGFVGASVQEGILQLNQEARSPVETAVGIATGTIVAGTLGAAVRYVDPFDIDRIGDSMVRVQGTPAIRPAAPPSAAGGPAVTPDALTVDNLPALRKLLGKPHNTGIEKLKEEAKAQGFHQLSIRETGEHFELSPDPESLSAAVNDTGLVVQRHIDDPGKILGTDTRLGRALTFTWLGPVTRQSMSAIPAFRGIMTKLDTGGLFREGNVEGVASALEGDVVSRVKLWNAGLAKGVDAQKRLFTEAYVNSGKGSAFRAFFAHGDFREFTKEVGKAGHMQLQGQRHPIAEVNSALEIYNKEVFGPAIREAIRLKVPGFDGLEFDTALKHMYNNVRRDLVNRDFNNVKTIVFENAVEQLRKNSALRENPKLVRLLGLDLDDQAFMTAREMGDIVGDVELANRITDRVMEVFSDRFQGHTTVDALVNFGSDIMHPFIFIDPLRKWSNGHSFQEFLETDVEKLARSFNRKMGPNIELFRAFGTVDPRKRESELLPFWSDAKKQIEELRTAADLIPDENARLKENTRISDLIDAFQKDLQVVVGRIRHDHGLPADPSAIGHRLGRGVLNVNTLRLMGGVVLASVADMARPILKYGFMDTFRHGLIPMLQDFKAFKMDAREAQYAGSALDLLMHGRSNAMFDLFDETEYGNFIERGLQTATNKLGQFPLAMFDNWNTGMKMFSGHIAAAKMSKDISDLTAGTATKQQVAFLAAHGIDENLARQMDKLIKGAGGTEVSPGVFMPNTQDWGRIDGEDAFDYNEFQFRGGLSAQDILNLERERDLARTFGAALNRAVDDTIVTPGTERASWVDATTAGRLISQFRSFTLSSTHKVLVASRQDALIGNQAQVLTGYAFSLALGLLSYYTWAQAVGGRTRERMLGEVDGALSGDTDSWLKLADEAIDRSGLIGVFAEARKFAERVPGIQDYARLSDAPAARSPFVSPVQDLLGPSAGGLDNLNRIVMTLHDPSSETFRKGKQLMPFQNVFWLRRALDNMNEAVAENVFGVQFQ